MLPVLTSVTSSYILWSTAGESTWRGATRLIVSAGVTLLVTIQWQMMGALVSMVTATVLAHIEARYQSPSRLVYLPSKDCLDPKQLKLTKVIEDILCNCSSLQNPNYIPTFWSSNKWANLCLYFVKQLYDKSALQSNKYLRELVDLPDGGTVAIDYIDDKNLKHDAPVVIFLHTITGSGLEVGHYMRYASRCGWHSCVFNRRGHAGVRLTSSKFNVVGDPADAVIMVDRVRDRYPNSYLAMVGISAGCGLLMSYLGSQHNTPIKAAAALCPAYDIERAFRLAINYPSMDQHILRSMKRLFLHKNKEILSSKCAESYNNCSNASTVHQFIQVHYTFAGYDNIEDYYAAHNPIDWIPKIRTPLLLINSEDDIVCLAENIREDIVRAQPGALLLRTNKGSHISFNEGFFGQGCYLSRVTMDYLETARKLSQTQNV